LIEIISKTLNCFKVSPVVAQEGEVVAKAGGADHQVKVSDHSSVLSQSSSFSAKDSAGFFIHWYYFNF